jgi:hypothetical protein
MKNKWLPFSMIFRVALGNLFAIQVGCGLQLSGIDGFGNIVCLRHSADSLDFVGVFAVEFLGVESGSFV